MINILIGGDICPMGSVQSVFETGRAEDIFHDLLSAIRSADLAVVNLECPLISRPSPISKAGPVLGVPAECIQGFVNAGWDVLNLANNHSYDHGAAGLHETIETIRKAGLAAVGAGANLTEAQCPVIRQINGRRIVLYSMAEREFSVADETISGANPLDLISFVQAVRQHKQNGVFITLLHVGKEFYPYPTPEMVRRCRFMIDMGADAVICCHTHCPLPWEIYGNRPIVYGLGNLIFEPLGSTLPPSWHQGYLASLKIDGSAVHLDTIPYHQSLDSIGATLMDETGASALCRELQKRSDELKDAVLLMNRWRDFCREQKTTYLSSLVAYHPIIWKLRRVLLPIMHTRGSILRALLLVQSETHREVIDTLFRDERFRD